MYQLLDRPRVEDVTLSDIQELCKKGAEEGHVLDFKISLPGNNDRSGQDLWVTRREISEEAKRALLKSVIAFANADGGWLVIGLSESAPGRAGQIAAFDGCDDLADRIGRIVASCIEPPLPICGVRGLEIEQKLNRGVIVIRVGASLLRPHRMRLGDWRHVYVRRGRDSMEMSMWEMQALTLETAQRVEKLEARLTAMLDRFEQFPNPEEPAAPLYGYIVAAVPLIQGPAVENVYRQEGLFQPKLSWKAALGGREYFLRSSMVREWGDVTPTLRGGRRVFFPTNNTSCCIELSWDGQIIVAVKYGYSHRPINVGALMADVANVILLASRWNHIAGAVGDFALQIELRDWAGLDQVRGDVNLFPIGNEHGTTKATWTQVRGFRSPIYRLSPESPQKMLRLLLSDLYHHAGHRFEESFEIEFGDA